MSAHDLVMRIEPLSSTTHVWNDLWGQTLKPNPFTSIEWYTALARNLLKCDPHVMVYYENDRVKAIIPAIISDDVIRLLGDERVTDLNDMVCAPGYEDMIVEHLAEYILRNHLGVDLYPLETDVALVMGLSRRIPELIMQDKDCCPLLRLPGSWPEYLANLDAKSRHELRRKLKKVNGAVIKDVQPTETERFFELMTVSDRGKKEFLAPEIRGFFAELIEVFDKKGWLRLRAAVIESRIIGMLLAFGFRGRVYLFNMGFDPVFRNLSPGIVTIGLDINSAIEEKYQYYDFLRGDEDYKYRLGAKERHTIRLKR